MRIRRKRIDIIFVDTSLGGWRDTDSAGAGGGGLKGNVIINNI